MDSKDTIKQQPTDEAGTISWRRYNQLAPHHDTAQVDAGNHVHIRPDPIVEAPASNAMVDNTIPNTIAIRHIIHKEVEMVVAHLMSEIDGLTQRCEELEIELGVTYDLV